MNSTPALNKKPLNKNPVGVGLSGDSGRMGSAVQDLIKKRGSGFRVEAKASLGAHFVSWPSRKIKGVIDFSAPVLFSQILSWCVKNKKPFVSGTTALSVAQKRALKKASKKIPIFYEENFSWGIWQITRWMQEASDSGGKILLEDLHHKNKKDRPSGTALKLKKNMPNLLQKKLKIKSFRVGQVSGTHRIIFQNKEEVVLVEHKALSRHLFARGALKALKWLIKQDAGLYSFEDLYIK